MIDLKTTLKNAVIRAGQDKLNVSLAVEIEGTHSWSMYYNKNTKTFSYQYCDTNCGVSGGMESDNDWCFDFEDCYQHLIDCIEFIQS